MARLPLRCGPADPRYCLTFRALARVTSVTGSKGPALTACGRAALDARRPAPGAAASIAARPGWTGAPSRTTGRPATTVCRAATGPAAQPRLDRVGERAGERRRPSSGQHTRSPSRADRRARRSRRPAQARPRRRGWRSPARRGPASPSGPPRSRPSSSALRASIHSDAESVDAEPSQPSPTGTPAARSSATGAMPPPPIIMFELGQCATPVPQRPEPGDLVGVRVDAVRHPRRGRCPSRRPRSARSVRRPKRLQAVAVLVGVLGQVGVQPDVEPLGQLGGAPASARGVTENGEHGRQRDPHHRRRRRVVVRPRPAARSRRGSRRRPAPPSRAAARRPSATASSSPGSGGTACPSSVAAAISAEIRSPPPRGVDVEVVGRWWCSRRGPARPAPPTPRGRPPPRRAGVHSG